MYNDAQMKVERDMLSSPNGKHVVTMSSDAPNINGVPPQPRPSGPLSELSDVYYTDLKTKKITHVWSVKKGKWVPVN